MQLHLQRLNLFFCLLLAIVLLTIVSCSNELQKPELSNFEYNIDGRVINKATFSEKDTIIVLSQNNTEFDSIVIEEVELFEFFEGLSLNKFFITTDDYPAKKTSKWTVLKSNTLHNKITETFMGAFLSILKKGELQGILYVEPENHNKLDRDLISKGLYNYVLNIHEKLEVLGLHPPESLLDINLVINLFPDYPHDELLVLIVDSNFYKCPDGKNLLQKFDKFVIDQGKIGYIYLGPNFGKNDAERISVNHGIISRLIQGNETLDSALVDMKKKLHSNSIALSYYINLDTSVHKAYYITDQCEGVFFW